MSRNAIEIRNLRKTYPARKNQPEKTALHGVDLDIPEGSMFALLGPNGAGKSTLINIMAGLVRKTEGTVKIWESDLDKDPRGCKSSIGVVPQEINLDMFFPPYRLLELLAGLYGVPKAARRTMELLEMVHLKDKAHATPRSLSGGMRRRLLVAKAMVHSPPILVLDEPTAGVDIELRQNLWENVLELNRAGVTIMLTTHYLEEAEKLCDRVAIMSHGRIVANDTKDNLLSGVDNKKLSVRTASILPAQLPEDLRGVNIERTGDYTLDLLYAPQDETALPQMLAALAENNIQVADISSSQRKLEDLFLDLTR